MASPRSAWSGTIRLGLFSAPITIGKATSEERERSLRDLCATHKVPVDRSERCSADPKCELADGKVKGVEVTADKWREFSAEEYSAIEDATKSAILEVLDVQPVIDLPLAYGMGTYFIRADTKSKGSELPVALLCDALTMTGFGLVVKWGTASRQRLAVIHARDEIVLLTLVPMHNELREPDNQETAHQEVEAPAAQISMLVDLLKATRSEDGFQHDAYEDEGYKRRAEAVERVLAGEAIAKDKDEAPVLPPGADATMAMLEASIEQAKKSKGKKGRKPARKAKAKA